MEVVEMQCSSLGYCKKLILQRKKGRKLGSGGESVYMMEATTSDDMMNS
jgi:hypothetical protein